VRGLRPGLRHILTELAIYIGVIAAATGVVWTGSDWLESSSVSLAAHYRLPPVVQGGVIAAVGSSFPELSSTVLATLVGGELEVGVGVIVGSAIFNIAGLRLRLDAVHAIEVGARHVGQLRRRGKLQLGLGAVFVRGRREPVSEQTFQAHRRRGSAPPVPGPNAPGQRRGGGARSAAIEIREGRLVEWRRRDTEAQ